MQRLTTLLFALAFLAAAPAFAQEKKPVDMSSAELLRMIQTDKKVLVGKAMALNDKEAKAFWPLYDTFQKELEGPQTQINRAILDFVNAGANITDANARRLAEQVLKAESDEAKLRSAQFSKLVRVVSPTKAARYLQVENKIRAVQRYETARAIPLAF
jgi:hypothetical protein